MTDRNKNINNPLESEAESSTANENNALIKKNLQTVINQNNKQDLTIFNQESKTNWTEIFGEGKGNDLLSLNKNARKYVGRNLTGLDNIMFERIIEKIGKLQHSKTGYVISQVATGISGIFPGTGSIYGMAFADEIDVLRMRLEKSFSVEEVTEIVKEVGELAGVDNSQMIKKIMEVGEKGQQHYEEKLWELGERIKELEADIKKEQDTAEREKEKYQTELKREKENTEREKQKLAEELTKAQKN